MEKNICQIKKSASEIIYVTLTEYRSRQMFSARVYYEDEGDYRPGKNGINLNIEFLPDIISALQTAEDEARAAGLLSDLPEGNDELQTSAAE